MEFSSINYNFSNVISSYMHFSKPSYNYKHIILAYICYLVMSFTNPLFFSMGTLILSAIMSSICMHDKKIEKCNLLEIKSNDTYINNYLFQTRSRLSFSLCKNLLNQIQGSCLLIIPIP